MQCALYTFPVELNLQSRASFFILKTLMFDSGVTQLGEIRFSPLLAVYNALIEN